MAGYLLRCEQFFIQVAFSKGTLSISPSRQLVSYIDVALEPNCEKVGWSTTLLTVINSFNTLLLEQIAKFVQEHFS